MGAGGRPEIEAGSCREEMTNLILVHFSNVRNHRSNYRNYSEKCLAKGNEDDRYFRPVARLLVNVLDCEAVIKRSEISCTSVASLACSCRMTVHRSCLLCGGVCAWSARATCATACKVGLERV